MSYTTHNINPKPYAYGCSIQIYWTTSANEYWNIFTKKKHICPNRRQKSSGTTTTTTAAADGIIPPSTAQKPRYYNPSAKNEHNILLFQINNQNQNCCLIHLNCLLPVQKKIYKNSMRCSLIS